MQGVAFSSFMQVWAAVQTSAVSCPEKCENCFEFSVGQTTLERCCVCAVAIPRNWQCHAGGILCYHDNEQQNNSAYLADS